MDQRPPTPPGGGEPPRDGAAWLARAFALARTRMSAVPAAVSGYRLFWVREGVVAWKDLAVGGPYAILGSHPSCDAVLPEPGVALRHVLAATVDLSDGPALRLLDLHSDMPFCLQDGSPQRSIVGVGAVVAHVGGTVFGGVPIEVGCAPEPPAAALELPEMVVSRSASVPVSAQASSVPTGTSAPRSRVTSMPPSSRLTDLRAPVTMADPPAPPSQPARSPPLAAPRAIAIPGPAPNDGRSAARELGPAGRSWSITLEHAGRAVSVALTVEQLAVGVVIGRAVRGHDGGLRAVLDTNISRGHLLLLHHHDTVEGYDLCSLNGTWEGGRRVTRRRLDDEPVTLSLSNHNPVLLHWRG